MKLLKGRKQCRNLIGMFLLSLVPILGFPAAFILAWTKLKAVNLNWQHFTAIFVILNVSVTIFALCRYHQPDEKPPDQGCGKTRHFNCRKNKNTQLILIKMAATLHRVYPRTNPATFL